MRNAFIVLTGVVGVIAEMNKLLLRLVAFQIDQQIHFTGFLHHLQRDIRHIFCLHSEIEIAEELSSENLSAMVIKKCYKMGG